MAEQLQVFIANISVEGSFHVKTTTFLEGLHLIIFKSLKKWLSYTIQWFKKVLKILTR